mmetsp:Transcript_9549/g.31184  ORF Transcript_9549/g.31184 Transcript_9549/m.31184 type:complete len:201 (+) Transcript_9549:1004-1606(+)
MSRGARHSVSSAAPSASLRARNLKALSLASRARAARAGAARRLGLAAENSHFFFFFVLLFCFRRPPGPWSEEPQSATKRKPSPFFFRFMAALGRRSPLRGKAAARTAALCAARSSATMMGDPTSKAARVADTFGVVSRATSTSALNLADTSNLSSRGASFPSSYTSATRTASSESAESSSSDKVSSSSSSSSPKSSSSSK